MKKQFNFSFIAIMIVFIMTSCSKEEEILKKEKPLTLEERVQNLDIIPGELPFSDENSVEPDNAPESYVAISIPSKDGYVMIETKDVSEKEEALKLILKRFKSEFDSKKEDPSTSRLMGCNPWVIMYPWDANSPVYRYCLINGNLYLDKRICAYC